jgi:hypothetical protein
MLTRRSFIHTAVLGCASCMQKKVYAADSYDDDDDDPQDDLPAGGCLLTANQSSKLLSADDSLDSSAAFATGDSNLDHQLGQALVRATQFFGITPAFGFYEKKNAQASPSVSSKFRGTWGTVLFGTPLFEDELKARDPSGMTIIAIVAHEFGHIIQFKRNLREQILANQPTVKRLELHADILSGYYIGSMKRLNPNLQVYSAGQVFDRIGDSDFSSPTHHGTSQERVKASQFGFNYGKAGTASLDGVINAGLQYVSKV